MYLFVHASARPDRRRLSKHDMIMIIDPFVPSNIRAFEHSNINTSTNRTGWVYVRRGVECVTLSAAAQASASICGRILLSIIYHYAIEAAAVAAPATLLCK